ncbi:MAG: hypothetical protein KDD25_09405, partial [Bdellovibrionales bacterium]|nr:hypothetical protein [Bdellovibrionales bacterium]
MLNVIRDLFSLFDKSDVKYALWKSLENIEKQVTGDDDLDILVDPQKKAEAFKICLDNGLHFNSLSKDRTGTRIHKFWGFDEETLKFVQFHIHYECAFGSKEFKEFRYPFESEMLNETISYSGVKRINDNHFFVTRILHAIAKNSKNDTFCLNLIKNWDDVAPEDQEHRLNLLNQTLGWMDSENMIRDLRKDFSKISNYQSR